MIPSIEECFEFMERYEMLDHIRVHSMVVEKIATLIGRKLKEAGVNLSLERIAAGALLHDIGKSLCLNTGEDHVARGREICLQNHLDEIADLVGEHVRLKDYNPDGPILEREIVYYADKRVNHDVVVSLQERLRYILRRYGKDRDDMCQRIRDNFDQCKAVERKLFAHLPFKPKDLAGMVK